MTDMSKELVLLKDESGNFYALSREMIEQARVPDDQKAMVEQLAEGDVSAFSGYLAAQPSSYSLAGTYGLTGGAMGSVIHARGYYFQFQQPVAGDR